MDGIDLTDLDVFAGGVPHEVVAHHQAEAPVRWQPPTAHTDRTEHAAAPEWTRSARRRGLRRLDLTLA